MSPETRRRPARGRFRPEREDVQCVHAQDTGEFAIALARVPGDHSDARAAPDLVLAGSWQLLRRGDDLPDPAFQSRWREVPRDGVQFALGILPDALDESRLHRVRGIEHEGAAESPQMSVRPSLRDKDLTIEEIYGEVALHEAAAQPLIALPR